MRITIGSSDHLNTLARRMKRGNRQAAAEIYDELLPKAYGFFLMRTGRKEIAEDLSQSVFLKLIEGIDSFDPQKGRFTVWFWQMSRNLLIDHYRKKKESPFSMFDDDAVEQLAIAEAPDIDEKLRYDHLKDFMATLAANERELFELRYVADMPFRDIALVLSKSEGSLRIAALRVKKKIQKEFQYA
ncbi:MAG TPA: sigma-70 family RNA polymerase sigma factor [Candidatus Paceibacterota bacterium]|nr:sigma-70 family RNA polymerase sigma factor [Candidatus Paceibacterota bacterium]